jgi:hypothetical protein
MNVKSLIDSTQPFDNKQIYIEYMKLKKLRNGQSQGEKLKIDDEEKEFIEKMKKTLSSRFIEITIEEKYEF